MPYPVAAWSKVWICGLSLSGISGSNSAGAWMSASCECCVLSCRGLASGWSLVQRSSTACGESECDREASITRGPRPTRGCCAIKKSYVSVSFVFLHSPQNKVYFMLKYLMSVMKFFFFHWHYSPLWALACRTMSFHFFLPATSSLHLLTPSTWRSLSTSSFHLFVGLSLLLIPSSYWVKIFLCILSSILSRWRNQLILCPFIHFTIFSPLLLWN